jgi:hypothetical protein
MTAAHPTSSLPFMPSSFGRLPPSSSEAADLDRTVAIL